jgi:hypothetical protein
MHVVAQVSCNLSHTYLNRKIQMPSINNKVTANGEAAFVGESALFNGMLGYTTSEGHAGVAGVADSGIGNGVYGRSKNANGVIGYSSATGHNGVAGVNEEGNGNGVYGRSKLGAGVRGESAGYDGVLGVSKATGHSGVAGVNDEGNGYGVYAHSQNNIGLYAMGGRLAGLFEGDVEVTGDIRLTNADCAEDFDIAGPGLVDPGTVMVLGEEGALYQSQQAYDKRVAGVVSGAGDFKPGIVLDKQTSPNTRQPIALLGKVYCKVDAQFGPIDVGDLLTTSFTPGHAMKVGNPLQAFGSVIGKALRPLKEGQGIIPILIALQ